MRTRVLFEKAGTEGGGTGGSKDAAGADGGKSGSSADGGADGKSGGGASGSAGDKNSGGAKDALFGSAGAGDSGGPGSGDGKGTGSGGTGGNDTNGKAGGDTGGVVIPANWKDALPPELKDAPFMAMVKDVPTLVQNYANAQKMIGADKLPIPGKHATTDEWKETMHKLGNPRTLDEYKFEMDPETEKGTDKAFIDKFRETAHGLGILPKQAGGLAKWFSELNKQVWSDTEAAHEQKLVTDMKGLEREWGTGYQANLIRAKAAITEFADKDTAEFLRDQGLGKNAKFLKFMAKVGESLSEDKLRGANNGQFTNALTPDQARGKIDEIKANPKHPYWNQHHENHTVAKKEYAGLFEQAFPAPQRT